MPPLCLSCALALTLLTSDVPVDNGDAVTMAALQQVAMSLEIMDPRETRYVFTRPEDFVADLKLVRARYSKLADAPPDADRFRFPSRVVVNDLLTFNRSYKQSLEQRLRIDHLHAYEIKETIKECDRLYAIWDAVRDSRCDYYYITVRRDALQKLRERVGFDAYYSGCLLPPVPICRFSVME